LIEPINQLNHNSAILAFWVLVLKVFGKSNLGAILEYKLHRYH
jgi:hypothetical protein